MRLRITSFLLAFLFFPMAFAWNIGSKEHVTGPMIHSTYFVTTNNERIKVHAKAYAGKYINGLCLYNNIYDIGNEQLKTGDTIRIDAYALKSLIGNQFDCMSIYYYGQQIVLETFQLITDGVNYIGTFPSQMAVTVT